MKGFKLISLFLLALLSATEANFSRSHKVYGLEKARRKKISVKNPESSQLNIHTVSMKKTPVTSTIREGITKNVTRSNVGWYISLGLSLTYAWLLLNKSGSDCNFKADGFCVTNLEIIDGIKSCPTSANSHNWSFLVDAAMTVVAVAIGKMMGKSNGLIGMIAGLIFGHGCIHLWLSSKNCYVPPTNISFSAQWVVYGIFIAGITAAAGITGGLSVITNAIVTIGGTWLTLTLSRPQYVGGVPPIFLYTQLLCSFLGGRGMVDNQLMADLFVAPCAVSILEVVACCQDGVQGFFNKIGGHVWYDFFLHISMIAVYLNK